jgi:hypothetical protein
VHADVLGEDGFLVEALRRLGASTVSIHTGTYSIDINLTQRGAPFQGRRA